jgi:oligopeptide/dipeptide ABC transporter ATP-binding protein
MYAGRIVEQATVFEIFERPLHPYTAALLRAMGTLRGSGGRLEALPGSVPSMLALPSGCRFRDRCPIAIDECARIDPLLEQKAAGHWAACIRV